MKPSQIACLIGIVTLLHGCSGDSTTRSALNGNSGIQEDEPTAPPILSIDNYVDVAGYSLHFFSDRSLHGADFDNPSPQDFSQPDSTTIDPNTNIETAFFTCPNGGTATRTDRPSDSDLFQFDNCQNGDSLLNGQLGFEAGKYTYNREFIGFTANINGGTAVHDVPTGKINNYSGNACGKQSRTRSVAQYSITHSGQSFELSDWNTSLIQVPPAPPLCDTSTLEVTGQYSVRSEDTASHRLQVTITEPITGTAYNPTAGVITITANDASQVAINFATNDDNTVTVTIINSNGESTFEEPSTHWVESLLRSGLIANR